MATDMAREQEREFERQFDWWYTNFCKENGRFPSWGECLSKREEIRKSVGGQE